MLPLGRVRYFCPLLLFNFHCISPRFYPFADWTTVRRAYERQ